MFESQLIFTLNELKIIRKMYRTDKFSKTTFIMVTYNRCPYQSPKENPLIWALQTLVYSELLKIDKFVIVNDCFTDYTEESLKWFEREYCVNLRYIKNNQRRGCSYSRKIGIENCGDDLFFLGDDDCLFKPYFILGSLITFKKLEKQFGNRLAVLSFPVFERVVGYTKTLSINYIGQTAFDTQWFYHNFDKFPQEYDVAGKEKTKYLGKDVIILEPFEITTFKGVTLCSRKAVLDAGNFLDLSMWENDYSEHIELSYKLQKKGYLMFHQPDPRISAIHLKFGSPYSKIIPEKYFRIYFEGVEHSLGDLIKLSAIKNTKTGCRVSDDIFSICEIGSLFSFYLKMSEGYAFKHAIRELKDFAFKNKLGKKEKQKRYLIWKEAILKAILITEKQVGKNYQQICRSIIKESEKIRKDFLL